MTTIPLILPPEEPEIPFSRRFFRAARRPFAHPARALLLILLGLLLVTQLQAQQQAPSPASDRVALKARIREAGFRVIIGMKPAGAARGMIRPGVSAVTTLEGDRIARGLADKGLRTRGRVSLIPVVFGDVSEKDLDRILDDPNVEYVEPDQLMRPTDLTTATFSFRSTRRFTQSTPWGVTQVTAPDAWALSSPANYGAGVKVGIMDSGIDTAHPDLAVAGGYNAVTGSTAAGSYNDDLAVCNGHGTHVAGTVAAVNNDLGVVGVAPGVSLYAIKVFQDLGFCGAYSSTQIAGLNWAVNNGIRVVSVSIGGNSYSSSYQSAISAAASKGVYFVAAAGNCGCLGVDYPAKFTDALAVASLGSSNQRSSFSSYGPEVFIGAPGEGITSTMPGGGYGSKSGTSMATPHVSGVIALLLARYPTDSRSSILSKLQQGALDVDAAGWDQYTGYGLIRSAESMTSAAIITTPPVLAVSPASRRDSADAGASGVRNDSATVSLSGTNASTTAWTASKKAAWITLTTASGTGSGKVRWSRSAASLSAGLYIDTITVTASGATGSPASVVDSFVVKLVTTPLTIAVSPTSRWDSVRTGFSGLVYDSATVSLSGMGASTAVWSATHSKSWLVISNPSGTGSGQLRWTSNPSGLLAGLYVDTLVVSLSGAAGSPTRIVDTLKITDKVTATGTKGRKTVSNGSSKGNSVTEPDSALVVADRETWQAATTAPWIELVTSGGIGDGMVRWNVHLERAAWGISSDSIVVTAGQGTARRVLLVIDYTAVVGMDEIPMIQAADALFGAQRLGDVEARMLDLVGNNNGRYDLGDFLAYIDRTGVALSAQVAAKVEAARKAAAARPPK